MTGLSARNLKYMRAFAKAWPDSEFVQQVERDLERGLIEDLRSLILELLLSSHLRFSSRESLAK